MSSGSCVDENKSFNQNTHIPYTLEKFVLDTWKLFVKHLKLSAELQGQSIKENCNQQTKSFPKLNQTMHCQKFPSKMNCLNNQRSSCQLLHVGDLPSDRLDSLLWRLAKEYGHNQVQAKVQYFPYYITKYCI